MVSALSFVPSLRHLVLLLCMSVGCLLVADGVCILVSSPHNTGDIAE